MINPIKPKPWLISILLVPALLAVGGATMMVLNAFHINLPNLNIIEPATQGIYPVTSTATVGKYFEYDFSKGLINDLEPQGRETPGIYSFYLGSGVGFPPMGLKLDMYGILKGTPTGTGDSKFQVCIKDVGGRSVCRTYSMSVVAKTTTASKPALNTNSASNGGQNTNVVQGTVRTEKWVGTYNNRAVEVVVGSDGACTTDTSAPTSLCLTWKGQNFEGPVDFPEGFKDTSSATGDALCLSGPHCGIGETPADSGCGYIRGYIDPSGNLKVSFLNLAGDIMSLMHDPNYNPITSEVMVGNSMTVEYSRVTHYSGSQSNKGSFTATKVSDSCN